MRDPSPVAIVADKTIVSTLELRLAVQDISQAPCSVDA